jgi:hypothetical protein
MEVTTSLNSECHSLVTQHCCFSNSLIPEDDWLSAVMPIFLLQKIFFFFFGFVLFFVFFFLKQGLAR